MPVPKTLFSAVLSGLVLLAVPTVQSQSFEEGYVVPAPGDTLHGQVGSFKRFSAPRRIQFRASDTAQIHVLLADTLHGFKVENRRYIRREVEIDTRPLTEPDWASDDATSRRDSVLLLTLAEGPLSLYYYRDYRRHFFLEKNGGRINELIRFNKLLYREHKTFDHSFRWYRQQIKNAKTEECQSIEVESLKYSVEHLSGIVDACNGDEGSVYVETGLRFVDIFSFRRLDIAAWTGISGGRARYRPSEGPDASMSGGGISVGATIRYRLDRPERRSEVRVELGLSRFRFSGRSGESIYVDDVPTRARGIVAQSSLLYRHAFLTGTVRPVVDLGTTLFYPLHHEGEGETNADFASLDYPWNLLSVGATGGVGMEWSVASVALRGHWAPALHGAGKTTAPTLHFLQLSFSYRF